MSSESNKLFCAILSAILVYLLASFMSELVYNVEEKKNAKLSYSLEKIEKSNPRDLKIVVSGAKDRQDSVREVCFRIGFQNFMKFPNFIIITSKFSNVF